MAAHVPHRPAQVIVRGERRRKQEQTLDTHIGRKFLDRPDRQTGAAAMGHQHDPSLRVIMKNRDDSGGDLLGLLVVAFSVEQRAEARLVSGPVIDLDGPVKPAVAHAAGHGVIDGFFSSDAREVDKIIMREMCVGARRRGLGFRAAGDGACRKPVQ